MMHHHVGHAIVRRAVESSTGRDFEGYELPSWTPVVFLIDFILILPILVFFCYTLNYIYPTLAIVEDENPPAYEPVALDADAATAHDAESQAPGAGATKPTHGRSETVTRSVRSVHRLLRANGGFRANFRGLAIFLAQAFMTSFLMGLFAASLGGVFASVATLLASLCLVQYSTAWVHIVITKPSKEHFWRRLPPFNRTFRATWKAVTLYWFATELSGWIPVFTGFVIGYRFPAFDFTDPTVLPDPDVANNPVWKGLVIVIVTLVAAIFITIPALVIVVRVQASLLPAEEETIIPFDHTFQGKVEPAVITGRGYATISDAWTTFSKAAWRRLIIMYVKVFAISMVGLTLLFVVIVPSIFLLLSNSTKHDGSSDEGSDL